ncbi:MAG: sterol desaturase family protein [Spirosomataceae bacterium]
MATKPKLFVTTDDVSPKLFESPILDFFTRIPWWVPIVVFLPVIVYFFYQGIVIDKISVWPATITCVSGLLFWSFFEYCVHRFLFHAHPTNPILKAIHYTFHGIHHDYPQDTLRLVMPLSVSIPLSTLIYLGMGWLFRQFDLEQYHHLFFATFMLGYLFYDEMHYASHHVNFKFKWFQAIKKQHMKHHFVEPDSGFGFTSKLWDWVFKTDFPEKKK